MRLILALSILFQYLPNMAYAKATSSTSTPDRLTVLIPEGEELSWEQKGQIIDAYKNGATIDGFVVTEEQLLNKKNEMLTHFSPEQVVIAKKAFEKIDYKRLRLQIFGLTQSIEFKKHLSKIEKINSSKIYTIKQAIIVSAPIMAFMATQLQEKYTHADVSIILPPLVLSAWIIAYIKGFEAISSFRSEGKTVKVDLSAPAGKQVSVTNNKAFSTVNILALEIVLNFFILSSLFVNQDIPAELAFRSFINVGATTYAKVYWELFVSDYLEAAKRTVNSEVKEALQDKALKSERIASNYLIPVFKLVHLLSPGGGGGASLAAISLVLFKELPLFVVGFFSSKYYKKHKNDWKSFDLNPVAKGNTCALTFAH